MLEKPWTIRHSGPYSGTSNESAVKERWAAISHKLLEEADKLGQNRHSERPPSGEYLETLAQLDVPKAVEDLEDEGFGIVDVIISYGQGTKLGPDTPYLTRSTAMGLKGYKPLRFDWKQIEESSQANGESPCDTYPPTPKTPAGALLRAKNMKPGNTRRYFPSTTNKRNSRPASSNKRTGISHLTGFIGKADPSVKKDALLAIQNRDMDVTSSPKASIDNIKESNATCSGNSTLTVTPTEPSTPCPLLRPLGTEVNEDISMTDAPLLATPNPLKPRLGPSPATTQAAGLLIGLSRPYQEESNIDPRLLKNQHSPLSSLPFFPPLPNENQPSQPHTYAQLTRESSFQETTNPFTTFAPSLASSPLTSPPSSPALDPKSSPKPQKWVRLKYTYPLKPSPSPSQDISPFKPLKSSTRVLPTLANMPKPTRTTKKRCRTTKEEAQSQKRQRGPSPQIWYDPSLTILEKDTALLEQQQQQNQPYSLASATSNTAAFITPQHQKHRPSNPQNKSKSSQRPRTARPSRQPPSPLDIEAAFEPDPLSQGGRIGYAPPGVLRQVVSARGGVFAERGVLVGVRFVVG